MTTFLFVLCAALPESAGFYFVGVTAGAGVVSFFRPLGASCCFVNRI